MRKSALEIWALGGARGGGLTVNLVKAVITYARIKHRRLGRVERGYGDVAGREEEVEVGGVEKRGGLGCAGVAKDTTALSAVMTSLKEREGDATVEVVAVGRDCIRLLEGKHVSSLNGVDM